MRKWGKKFTQDLTLEKNVRENGETKFTPDLTIE